jgi:hypothetical protein
MRRAIEVLREEIDADYPLTEEKVDQAVRYRHIHTPAA